MAAAKRAVLIRFSLRGLKRTGQTEQIGPTFVLVRRLSDVIAV